MAWKEWQLYDLRNEFTVLQCEMEKVVRDVNLWLIYALLPAVIGNILNVQDSGLFGRRGAIVWRQNWKKRKMKSAGAFSLGRTVSIHLCTYSQHLLLAFPIRRASLCRMLAAVIHCITVYKQPPPSLHRQQYHAVWYTYCPAPTMNIRHPVHAFVSIDLYTLLTYD